MKSERFPIKLLEKGKEAKIKYFEDLTIAHPNLSRAFNEIWQSINFSKPGAVILVFGSTGVGKTTLMKYLEKRIIESLFDQLKIDSSIIPYVSVEASMPVVGNFDWKELFRDMLEVLNEPSISGGGIRTAFLEDAKVKNLLTNDRQGSAAKFRYVVEKSLQYRKPKAVLIDEGQHLTVLSSARKLLDQQNTIKSIANRTKTTHILFGNYDLLFLRNLNGQLARRTQDTHFIHYDVEKAEDITAFQNVLWMFQSQIPVEEIPDLLSFWEYLYERSMGCVGILKDWLDRAFKKMLEDGDKAFVFKHLESTALPMVKCQIIANEIRMAEEKISLENSKLGDLRSLLKMNHLDHKKHSDSNSNPIKRKRNVGMRNPKRDAIGSKTLISSE